MIKIVIRGHHCPLSLSVVRCPLLSVVRCPFVRSSRLEQRDKPIPYVGAVRAMLGQCNGSYVLEANGVIGDLNRCITSATASIPKPANL